MLILTVDAAAERLAAGDAYEALHMAELLARSPQTDRERAGVLLVLGRAHLTLRQWIHASSAFESLLLGHVEQLLAPERVRIELDLAIAQLHCGDLSVARDRLNALLDTPDLPHQMRADAYWWLAEIPYGGERYEDALPLLDAARTELLATGDTDRANRCRERMAWAHLQLMQPVAAHDILAALDAEYAHAENHAGMQRIVAHWGLYGLQLGDAAASLVAMADVIGTSIVIDPDDIDGQADLGECCYVTARCAFALGHYRDAMRFAGQAREHGMWVRWPGLLNRSNRLYREAECEWDREELGDSQV